ncbi:hypothetical protein V1524DRAFT_221885 [Lipomyces starkeyi]
MMMRYSGVILLGIGIKIWSVFPVPITITCRSSSQYQNSLRVRVYRRVIVLFMYTSIWISCIQSCRISCFTNCPPRGRSIGRATTKCVSSTWRISTTYSSNFCKFMRNGIK